MSDLLNSNTSREIIYGIRPLDEISRTTGFYSSDVIYTAHKSPHIRLQKILHKAKKSGARLEKVSPDKINKLAGALKNQGILLQREESFPHQEIYMEDIIRQRSGLYVLVERLNDPQNLGSIVRSMAAFGCQGLILNKKRTPPLGQVVWKVSSGALSHLPVLWVNGARQFVAKLKERSKAKSGKGAEVHPGLCFIGADLRGERLDVTFLHKLRAQHQKIFLVLGDEEKGISPDLRENLDFLVRIPHETTIDSLNVGVAAGILLYLFSRVN